MTDMTPEQALAHILSELDGFTVLNSDGRAKMEAIRARALTALSRPAVPDEPTYDDAVEEISVPACRLNSLLRRDGHELDDDIAGASVIARFLDKVADSVEAAGIYWDEEDHRIVTPVPAVPEGYKLVPVEPTDEICEALEECLRDHGFDHDGIGELSKAACWDAMLAAAPTAEESSGDGESHAAFAQLTRVANSLGIDWTTFDTDDGFNVCVERLADAVIEAANAGESSGDGDTVTMPRAVYDMLAKKAGIEDAPGDHFRDATTMMGEPQRLTPRYVRPESEGDSE